MRTRTGFGTPRRAPSRIVPAEISIAAPSPKSGRRSKNGLMPTRAFVPGTAVNGVTPLVFQDAAAVSAEGEGTPAFGTATSSTSSGSRERLLALGVRVAF